MPDQGAAPPRDTPDPLVITGFAGSICGGEITLCLPNGEVVKLETPLSRGEMWPYYSRTIRVTVEAIDDHGERFEEFTRAEAAAAEGVPS